MPVIRQEHGIKTVAGLPVRWGRRAYAEMALCLRAVESAKEKLRMAQAVPGANCATVEPIRERLEAAQEQYANLCRVLDEVTSAPVPVDATDARLCMMASQFAADCAAVPLVEFVGYAGDGPRQAATMRERMEQICRVRGITPPAERDDEQAMRRMVDGAWWRRNLRTLHGRVFEHAAQRLAFVSIRAGSYCSNETVKRRREQIERNQAAMKAHLLKNEAGQTYSLYDLAAKGMANKTNRKGELMMRMAGCEDIAVEMGHVGLFVTLTCPSRFHAVLERTGKTNPKYLEAGAPSPRMAQEYLNSVWARTRAQNARDGIAPYGFRIAEPHHDGCPHWHMLVFMPATKVDRFCRNLEMYACAEDAYEITTRAGKWARDARLKIITIDASKGTAAGYIAKYVGKNIDDSQGEAFDDEGQAQLDPNGDPMQSACHRVDAWAGVWGIRQFQGLGMPPVTVWRELRRVANMGDDAPAYMRRALKACQRVESKFVDAETGKPGVIHAADFAEYIRAQGGVNMGRDYRIAVAYEAGVLTSGRYGAFDDANLPAGVYARAVGPSVVYPSTRYLWKRVGVASAVDVRGCLPWSPLNNCTASREAVPYLPGFGPSAPSWWSDECENLPEYDDYEWFGSEEAAEILAGGADLVAEWVAERVRADEKEIAAGRVPGRGVFCRAQA